MKTNATTAVINEEVNALPSNLFGAFYQISYTDEPRVKELKKLLDMISTDNSDEVKFISIDAENSFAFGFVNITKFKEGSIYHLANGDVERIILSVLNDVTLETKDNIYEIDDIKVYLDYTFAR